MPPGEVVINTSSGLRYRIVRHLGSGGFGSAYLARTSPTPVGMPSPVCLKLTIDLQSWVSETYFGFVLRGVPGAVRMHDAFIDHTRPGLLAIASEYASNGDLASYLRASPEPWTPIRVCREVIGILRVLDVLHRGRALHRNLTPFNVFVSSRGHLRLGDFGIARHHVRPIGVPALTMARWMAPKEIAGGNVRHWQARDDVFQVGQLLGMLLQGQADRPIRSRHISSLPCDDRLKEVIQQCIGHRGKRFETAGELIEHLLRAPKRLREGRARSLEGMTIVFTGRLSISRDRAARLARRAGATVAGSVSAATDIVVRGRANPLQVAGVRGQKLIDVEMWRERGKKIKVIGESQFRRLVERGPGR